MVTWRQDVNTEGEPLRNVYVEHEPVNLEFLADDGMTRQEFRDECDINVLMATYQQHGVLPPINRGTPQYLDVSDVPDLAHALAVVDAAQEAFMRLPAHVRREFDQDPVKFMDYAADPANLPRMREWGLAAPAAPAGSSNGDGPGTPSLPSGNVSESS